MNTIKHVSLTTFLSVSILMAAGLVFKPVAHSSTINPAGDLQTITVSAMRMTTDQKAAFDYRNSQENVQGQAPVQAITVIGRSMSAAQKAAFDRSNKA